MTTLITQQDKDEYKVCIDKFSKKYNLNEKQCEYFVKHGIQFEKGLLYGATAKRSGKNFNDWEGAKNEAELFFKQQLKASPVQRPMQTIPVTQPVSPITQVPQTQATMKYIPPKEKSSFYEDLKNGKNWIQCTEGQPGCVPYSQLYVDDFSGERKCNIAVVNNGRENVVYDGTGKTQMTLEKKCEQKRGPVYLRGGTRTKTKRRKPKRKTR
jgi:hypothetical protein